MWSGESSLRMIVHDIEEGAGLMVVERDHTGLTVERWTAPPSVAADTSRQDGCRESQPNARTAI
jgi:hypothetical protein